MAVQKKTRVLTEKQSLFLDALLGDAKGNYRTAMRIAGYSDTVPVREVVSSLREEIVDQAMNYLAANAPKAAIKLVDLLDDPTAGGASNTIKIAQQVLDRAGARAPEESGTLKIPSGGLFIMPAKQSALPMVVVEHDEDEVYED